MVKENLAPGIYAQYALWFCVPSGSLPRMVLPLAARHSVKRSESFIYFCELMIQLFSHWGQRKDNMRHDSINRDQLALCFLEGQCKTNLENWAERISLASETNRGDLRWKVWEGVWSGHQFSKWWSCFGLSSPHGRWRPELERSSIHFLIGSWASLSRAWGLSAQDC